MKGSFVKQLLMLALSVGLWPLCAFSQERADKFVGTGSCSSSNCHGSVHPLKASNVLQNEYYTWLKHDKHSQAYSVLMKADGRRMAALLNLGDPTKEPLCLKCHSTYVPNPALHGAKFDLEDGVSCESCHGAAERWLESHSESDATHEQNLSHGLFDTVSLDSRARLCVSCHYGDDDKRVTHDLYGAGHPRLSFELDTFGVLQPKHWVTDDDYLKRKGPYVPLAAWFIGQETQAEAVVATILSPQLSKNGLFPELSLFDCFSCHHSLGEEQWKHRTYGGSPGRLSLNLAPLLMLQQTLGALDESLAAEYSALVVALHTSYQTDGAREVLEKLKVLLSARVRPLLMKLNADQKVSLDVVKRLGNFGATTQFPKYEVAEQIGMGIQAAMATSPYVGKRYKAPLDQLFVTLQNAKSFKPEKFTAAAAKLASSIQ